MKYASQHGHVIELSGTCELCDSKNNVSLYDTMTYAGCAYTVCQQCMKDYGNDSDPVIYTCVDEEDV